MMRFIEICCASVEDVIAAKEGGASRIELCQAIRADGVTPSYGLIKEALKAAGHMPVNVLIRPREGNFVYSVEEIKVMEEDIRFCKEVGVAGVVVGALTPDGNIDDYAMKRLMEASTGMSVTFHRAFDSCKNPVSALEHIISLGCDRILTSGLKSTAIEGKELLRELVLVARDRIIIMPGGGVNPLNIVDLSNATGAKEFHSTATDKSITMPVDTLFGSNPRHTSREIVAQLVSLN